MLGWWPKFVAFDLSKSAQLASVQYAISIFQYGRLPVRPHFFHPIILYQEYISYSISKKKAHKYMANVMEPVIEVSRPRPRPRTWGSARECSMYTLYSNARGDKCLCCNDAPHDAPSDRCVVIAPPPPHCFESHPPPRRAPALHTLYFAPVLVLPCYVDY